MANDYAKKWQHWNVYWLEIRMFIHCLVGWLNNLFIFKKIKIESKLMLLWQHQNVVVCLISLFWFNLLLILILLLFVCSWTTNNYKYWFNWSIDELWSNWFLWMYGIVLFWIHSLIVYINIVPGLMDVIRQFRWLTSVEVLATANRYDGGI